MNKKLSIVLPCYNPPDGWEQRVVQNIDKLVKDISSIELILVNDGSETDISSAITFLNNAVRDLKYISYATNKGKGNAIRTGLAAATADHVIYTDIDFPYSYESLISIYQTLQEGYDVAAGVKNNAYYSNAPRLRTIMSKSLRWMSARLLKISVNDTQCGLKGMNAKAKAVWLEGQIDRYLFDLEAIYRAELKGYKIKEVPVSLREGVVFSKIKISMMLTELMNFMRLYFSK